MSFAKITNVATQTITGVGFSGKAFIFYNADTSGNTGVYEEVSGYRGSVGFATTVNTASPVIRSMGVGIVVLDAVGTSDSGTIDSQSGAVLMARGAASSAENVAGAVTAVDGDSFTINWVTQTNPISGRVEVDIFGGTDIVNVSVVPFTHQSGHGSQTTSGLGFQPNVVFVVGGNRGTAFGAATAHARLEFGMATSSTNEVGLAVCTRDAAATMVTKRWMRTDRTILTTDVSGIAEGQAEFTSFAADGITFNWISGARNSNIACMLAMKVSGNIKVGNFNNDTGTGNMSTSGVGFSGKYALLTSVCTGINNSAGTSGHNRLMMGGATSPTQEGSFFLGDEDLPTTSILAKSADDGNIIRMADEAATASASTTSLVANFESFHSDGITINRTTNEFTGEFSGATLGYCVIGDIIAAGGAPPEVETIQPKAFVMGPSTMDNVHQGFGGGEGGFQPGNLPPLFGTIRTYNMEPSS